MKRRRKGLSVMHRTLLSLLLVALIPICSTLVVFYNYNVEALREDIEQINLSRAQQIRGGFESEIMSHQRLRQSLYADQLFLPLIKRGGASDLYDAITMFREYLGYRGALGDAVFFDMEQDLVLHRTGISSRDNYFRSILQVESAEGLRIENRMKMLPPASGQGIMPLHFAAGSTGLLFFYPLPAYSNSGQMLLITLSAAEVTEIFGPLLGDLEGSAFLLNDSGELLFSTGDAAVVEAALTLSYEPQEFVLPLKAENGEYSVIYTKSPSVGLTYGVAVSKETYLTKVIKQTTLIWQMVFLAFILCAVAILFLTMLNYRPIKLLMELLGPKEEEGDEYERIRNAVVYSRRKAELLENALQIQKPYVLERLLSYIFNSQLGAAQAESLFTGMDLRFEHACFFVICVRYIRARDAASSLSAFKAAVMESAEAMCTGEAVCYTLERLDDDNLSVVVNCADTLDRKAYSRRFYGCIDEQVQKGYVFTLGVGSLTGNFDGLRNSMYEAKVLVEELSDREISLSEDMESLPCSYRGLYSVKDTMLFAQQLRQGDGAAATASFQKLYAEAAKQAESRMLFRHAVSYVVGALTDTVQQLCGDQFGGQVQALLAEEEPAAHEKAACALIGDFCRKIREEKDSSGSRLSGKILAYIDGNCTNPDLSLERIAEEFGLSTYYISRFFRDQNNMNFKDYLSNLRIEKAKEWLTQTEKPVSDIVSGLGYQSPSSFIRKFKAVTGVTPGRYRELYGQ